MCTQITLQVSISPFRYENSLLILEMRENFPDQTNNYKYVYTLSLYRTWALHGIFSFFVVDETLWRLLASGGNKTFGMEKCAVKLKVQHSTENGIDMLYKYSRSADVEKAHKMHEECRWKLNKHSFSASFSRHRSRMKLPGGMLGKKSLSTTK